MNLIGPNIRKIRESKNMTQGQLVAKCNLVEFDISRSTLAKIESKCRRITDIEVVIFSKVLNVELDELFVNN